MEFEFGVWGVGVCECDHVRGGQGYAFGPERTAHYTGIKTAGRTSRLALLDNINPNRRDGYGIRA